MARAKRHYISGHIWHITHHCHKREFLLRFAKDRRRWLHWLLDAKRRYGLVILNYMVTSNQIHLLVVDDGDRDVIPRSIQLVAGRTAREYNQRKRRKGAFWEEMLRFQCDNLARPKRHARSIFYQLTKQINSARA